MNTEHHGVKLGSKNEIYKLLRIICLSNSCLYSGGKILLFLQFKKQIC